MDILMDSLIRFYNHISTVERSLLDSRSKTLSKVVTVKESTEALSVIVSVKKVPSDQRQQYVLPTPSLPSPPCWDI